MKIKEWAMAVLALATLGLAGCRTASRMGPGTAEKHAPPGGPERSMKVSPAMVAALQAEYPVLGGEPAPEPQPRPDAMPALIPARVAETLPEGVLERVTGEATYYADYFDNRQTASGIPFRQHQFVAAHRAYPFGTLLRVTNLRNQRSVNVRVVDRGPFGAAAEARNTIIDLSRRAADRLGYVGAGRTPVKVEVLEWGAGLPATGLPATG